MGTWDKGPFDNDTAADWSGDLHDAPPEERIRLVRQAFEAVTRHGEDYLDSDLACDAIAAAAVVSSQLPGGEPLTTAYAPDFLVDGGTLDIPADVPGLALRALDRIAADDSEWRSLWEYTHEQAMTELQPLRTQLERAAS